MTEEKVILEKKDAETVFERAFREAKELGRRAKNGDVAAQRELEKWHLWPLNSSTEDRTG